MTEQHYNSGIGETVRYSARHKSGFILLVLVMALVVLSLLAVEFQTESAMQIRISSHRQDVIQCDYALESGLAAASKLIQEYHDEMMEKIRNPQAEPVAPEVEINKPEDSSDPNEADDPNAIEDEDGILTDPNATLGLAPTEWKGHLLRQATVDVGKAKVEIFIYGENYKLPLIWALKSPYVRQSTQNGELTMVTNLLNNLKVDSSKLRDIQKYISYLTADIKVPYRPGLVKKENRWVSDGESLTNEEVSLLTVKNHILFATIGSQWHRDVNNQRYPEIKEALTLASNNLVSDYLGIWGGIRININTAPAEVLAAGFKDVGLTMELAEKIVATRKEKGLFRASVLIREIPGLEQIYTGIYPMCEVIDHAYTVKIVAQSGEVKKVKSACFYRNGKKLEILAVF